MYRSVFTIAAILSTAVVFVNGPANAGGKRLQFGYPLGSFTASPHSGGASHSRRSASKKRRYHASKKAAARRAAARKAAARRAAAKKAAARKLAAQKAAARKIAAKKAHARQLAAKRAAQKKIAARKAAARRIAAKKAASRKLAARKADAAEDVVIPARNPDAEVAEKKSPVKASAIAGTNTLKFEDDDATDVADLADEDNQVTVEETNADTRENDQDIDQTAQLECRKYIPSAGLTISVACGS